MAGKLSNEIQPLKRLFFANRVTNFQVFTINRLRTLFFYKTHIRLAKKNFPVKFYIFWPTLKPDIPILVLILEKRFITLLQIFTVFKSVIRFLFGCHWIDFYSFAYKLHPNFSIWKLWRANQSRWDQLWAWFRKLLLRSTNRYINQANCMHQSRNLACQSCPIIAKFCTLKQLFWLNQVTSIPAIPARILKIFFSTKPNPTAWVWWEKLTPTPLRAKLIPVI